MTGPPSARNYLNQMRWYSRLMRVEEQRDERTVEQEVDDGERRQHLGAEDQEQHHDLQDRAADGDRVAPLLLVGDAEPAGRQCRDRDQAGQHRGGDEAEEQPEDSVDVAEDRGHVEGLGLELIDPLPLVHGSIVADGGDPRGIAARERSCPHAAAMSVPRLRRTVAVTPCALQPVRERPQRRPRGRVAAEPVGRVERDQVHVRAAHAGERAEQPPQRLGLARASRSRPRCRRTRRSPAGPWRRRTRPRRRAPRRSGSAG